MIQPQQPQREMFNSITILRGIAASVVVWTHLVSQFAGNRGFTWLPLDLVRKYINNPLRLDAHFIHFGVLLFFFISGFIITHVAMRETRLDFVVKRLLRIYPPLIASVVLIVIMERTFSLLFGRTYNGIQLASLSSAIQSVILFNRLLVSSVTFVNPVAWTLVAEILFYTLTFIFLPFIKKHPHTILIVELIIVISFSRLTGTFPVLFGVDLNVLTNFFSSTQTPLLIGQTLYLLWSKRIGPRFFAFATIMFWCENVFWNSTFNRTWYETNPTALITTALAYCLFVIFLLMDQKLTVNPILRFLSTISYSLYLNHYVVGWIFLPVLLPVIGYTKSLAITLVIVLLVSYLSYRLVEAPSQRLARRILERIRRKRERAAVAVSVRAKLPT